MSLWRAVNNAQQKPPPVACLQHKHKIEDNFKPTSRSLVRKRKRNWECLSVCAVHWYLHKQVCECVYALVNSSICDGDITQRKNKDSGLEME